MSQVGEQTKAQSGYFIFDDKANAVDGIMRRWQGFDSQRTNLKRLSGHKMIRTSNTAEGWLGTSCQPSFQICVDRQTEFSVKHTNSADVIAVLM
jgi:hypothetical protein